MAAAQYAMAVLVNPMTEYDTDFIQHGCLVHGTLFLVLFAYVVRLVTEGSQYLCCSEISFACNLATFTIIR